MACASQDDDYEKGEVWNWSSRIHAEADEDTKLEAEWEGALGVHM